MRDYETNKSNSWKKSGIKPKNIPKEKFIEICLSSESMAHAASKLGLHFGTFKKYAEAYECYKTNQSSKGNKKEIKIRIENLEDYATRSSVRQRILKENLLPYKCDRCGINKWEGEKLSLHLDHKNGDCWDHKIENLRFLCPNCHSLTSTYAGKNK